MSSECLFSKCQCPECLQKFTKALSLPKPKNPCRLIFIIWQFFIDGTSLQLHIYSATFLCRLLSLCDGTREKHSQNGSNKKTGVPGVIRTAEGEGGKKSRLKANTMKILSLGKVMKKIRTPFNILRFKTLAQMKKNFIKRRETILFFIMLQ